MTEYKANCHCGAVRMTLTFSPSLSDRRLIQCNCSLCNAHGLVMTHLPRGAIVFRSGFDKLTGYQSATSAKSRVFRFCSVCGTGVIFDVEADCHGTGKEEEFVGINVSFSSSFLNNNQSNNARKARTIQGVDAEIHAKDFHNGRDQGMKYIAPE